MKLSVSKGYVGIDVSKDRLDIAIPSLNINQAFTNCHRGHQKLIKLLGNYDTTLVTMEASGGYEQQASIALQKSNIAVAVVNAKRVREFAGALGICAKTDKLDANVIAYFADVVKPRQCTLRSKLMTQLREWNGRRRQIVELIKLEKRHLEHASAPMAKLIKQSIARMEKQVAAIEDTLHSIIDGTDDLKKRAQLMMTVQGVGFITAVALLCELPELGTVSSKEIAAIVGVAPYPKDSGKSKKPRNTRGGRSKVRYALYMAVLSAKRHCSKIREFYDKLIAAGKRKQVAMIACIRKLAVILNAMVKHQQPWREMQPVS